MKGHLIIISSPSGGGKGTLIKEVLERVPNLGYSVSLTTRAPRFGEEDGRHYHFVSKEEFQDEIENDGFLEYAEVHENLYGTAKSQIDRITAGGRDVILEIDVQGAEAVMRSVPDAVSIFILPPSYETLRARLTARATEKPNDLDVRLRNSLFEVSRYSLFKYVIINDEVHSAAAKLASVIVAERQLRNRQSESIQGILDSFERSNV
ncbi:MAG: guanylate kinase [bacterium]|nr:guanylate kinase [bacterium]